ncbi:MAG: hypothetical protein KGH58_03405 [Candidatus Micrarchaeota archaeon]|nr:hypothetical protein [Candidatus Micrarchaeota archaeon]
MAAGYKGKSGDEIEREAEQIFNSKLPVESFMVSPNGSVKIETKKISSVLGFLRLSKDQEQRDSEALSAYGKMSSCNQDSAKKLIKSKLYYSEALLDQESLVKDVLYGSCYKEQRKELQRLEKGVIGAALMLARDSEISMVRVEGRTLYALKPHTRANMTDEINRLRGDRHLT